VYREHRFARYGFRAPATQGEAETEAGSVGTELLEIVSWQSKSVLVVWGMLGMKPRARSLRTKALMRLLPAAATSGKGVPTHYITLSQLALMIAETHL
jgi:hypothetical protein